MVAPRIRLIKSAEFWPEFCSFCKLNSWKIRRSAAFSSWILHTLLNFIGHCTASSYFNDRRIIQRILLTMWAELFFVKAADFNYCCALVALVNVILYLTIIYCLSWFIQVPKIGSNLYISHFYAKPYHISYLTYLYPSYFILT